MYNNGKLDFAQNFFGYLRMNFTHDNGVGVCV